MTRTTDIVKPYRVQLVHDDSDRRVGINIKAVEGSELDHDTAPKGCYVWYSRDAAE